MFASWADLLEIINELRMRECIDSVALERDQRAANLLTYLDRCNYDRGPGFLLFGSVVLDIALLKRLAVVSSAILGNYVAYFHLFNYGGH